jgi:hypothetical protein
MLTRHSLYFFKRPSDVNFELMIPLENLRLFVEAPHLLGSSWLGECGMDVI